MAGARERVLTTIREMGFHPNPLARDLATNLTPNLGLIVPDISNPLFALGIDGSVAMAEQFGSNGLLATAGGDPQREARRLRALPGQRVLGMVRWVNTVDDAALALPMEDMAIIGGLL